MTVRASVSLFDQLVGPGTAIDAVDRSAAAKTLGVPVAKVMAVEAVESRGRGFREDAARPGVMRPIILFEPHQFHKRTGGRFSADWPEISYPTWGTLPYPSSQSIRWAQLRQAMALDECAALASASWGLFQIMGFNFKPASFASVQDFARAMATTEGAQLAAFARLVASQPAMLGALRLSDWAGFARLYNGPGYAQHGYDQKLKTAYLAAQAARATA